MVARTPRSCAALARTLVRCPRSRTRLFASSLAPFSLPLRAAALISMISFFSSRSMANSSRSKSAAQQRQGIMRQCLQQSLTFMGASEAQAANIPLTPPVRSLCECLICSARPESTAQ
jgi:hypothetical protein